MLAHLSASIFTSKSNHNSLIGHGILLYNFHKYCMIHRLSMFEKLKNITRDTVCRRFLHHIVLCYYIWDIFVCRKFMHHIVVSYYIKATDVKKMVTRFVVNYHILPIDVNAVARQNTRGIWKVMHIHSYNCTQWSEKKDEGINVNARIWGF